MNNVLKIAQEFEHKLISKAEMSDSDTIARIIGHYESTSEFLDVLISAVESNLIYVENDKPDEAILNIVKDQAKVMIAGIKAIQPKMMELDSKLQELY